MKRRFALKRRALATGAFDYKSYDPTNPKHRWVEAIVLNTIEEDLYVDHIRRIIDVMRTVISVSDSTQAQSQLNSLLDLLSTADEVTLPWIVESRWKSITRLVKEVAKMSKDPEIREMLKENMRMIQEAVERSRRERDSESQIAQMVQQLRRKRQS